MKVETLIKRAKEKMVRKLEKAGKSEEFIKKAIEISFPSL